MYLATAQSNQSINQIKSLFLPIHEIKRPKTETSMQNKSGNQSPIILSAYVTLHPSFAYIKATTPATTPTNVATTTDDFIIMPLEGAPP